MVALVLLLFLLVKSGEPVLIKNVHSGLCDELGSICTETGRFYSLAVHGDDFKGTVCGNGYQIGGEYLVG